MCDVLKRWSMMLDGNCVASGRLRGSNVDADHGAEGTIHVPRTWHTRHLVGVSLALVAVLKDSQNTTVSSEYWLPTMPVDAWRPYRF
jgi:hypothetical protein